MNVLLSLCSNLGEAHLWRAIDQLRPHLNHVRLSPFFFVILPAHLPQPHGFLNVNVQAEYTGSLEDLYRLTDTIKELLRPPGREQLDAADLCIDLLSADNTVVPVDPLKSWPLLAIDKNDQVHLPTISLNQLTPWWLMQAVEHMGAFLLDDALVPEVSRQLIHEARQTFRSPMRDKMACQKKLSSESGYSPPGTEKVVRDEGFDFNRELWDIRSPYHTKNQLPNWDNGRFRDLALMTYRHMEQIATICSRQLDGARQTTLESDARNGDHMLRCSRYLCKGDPERVLFNSHRDLGLWTLFGGGTEDGLEGEWGDRWYPMTGLKQPGRVLVGVGSTLRLYLPPTVRSFHHRVTAANMTDDERISYSLFTEARRDVTLPNGQNAGERLDAVVNKIRRTTP